MLLQNRHEGRVDFALRAGGNDDELPPECLGGNLGLSHVGRCIGIIRVHKQGNYCDLSNEFPQHFEPFCNEFDSKEAHTSDITARPIEPGDKAKLDRIKTNLENNRDCCRCRLRRDRRGHATACEDNRHLSPNQVGR